jgi:integrase
VSPICPKVGVVFAHGWRRDSTAVGARIPGRAGARTDLVREISPSGRAAGPKEARARLDRARPAAGGLFHQAGCRELAPWRSGRGASRKVARNGPDGRDVRGRRCRVAPLHRVRPPAQALDGGGIQADRPRPPVAGLRWAPARIDHDSDDRELVGHRWRHRELASAGARAVHGIFQRAKNMWGLATNPASDVEKPPLKPSGDIQVFSPEEVWALVRAARSKQDAAIFLTAAFTGLRRGELLALHWRDVDFTSSVVRVRASYSDGHLTTPKSGKVRSVPMAPDVAAALAKLGQREVSTGDDDLVFLGEEGGYVDGSALRRRYDAALARGGLRRLRFHDLRHTFGTRMIAKADIRRVQEWMGHSSIQTTMKYLHYAPREEDARLVAEAFMLPAAGPNDHAWRRMRARECCRVARGSEASHNVPERPEASRPSGQRWRVTSRPLGAIPRSARHWGPWDVWGRCASTACAYSVILLRGRFGATETSRWLRWHSWVERGRIDGCGETDSRAEMSCSGVVADGALDGRRVATTSRSPRLVACMFAREQQASSTEARSERRSPRASNSVVS